MNKAMLKQNFENHGFFTSFFETKEEAAEYILNEVKNTSVTVGGSMTMKAMGLFKSLKEQNEFYNHTPKEEVEKLGRELTADVFICSANGVSETGEIVNIDGTGNRVVGTIYGHNRVYFLVGKNKLVPTLAEAVERARVVAAPPNCKRLEKNTPCSITGTCSDCNSPERICRVTVIHDRAQKQSRVEVVFINEDLGY